MGESLLLGIVIAGLAVASIALASIVLARGRQPAATGGSAIVLLLPVLAYALGDLQLLEDSKHVAFCGSCHESMGPLVESMQMDTETLASSHYRTDAVTREHACYECHSGYGISGDLRAKLDGMRHMWLTATGAYAYPLRSAGFDVESCMACHGEPEPFLEVEEHAMRVVQERLASGEIGCTGECHGPSHRAEALRGVAFWEKKKRNLR